MKTFNLTHLATIIQMAYMKPLYVFDMDDFLIQHSLDFLKKDRACYSAFIKDLPQYADKSEEWRAEHTANSYLTYGHAIFIEEPDIRKKYFHFVHNLKAKSVIPEDVKYHWLTDHLLRQFPDDIWILTANQRHCTEVSLKYAGLDKLFENRILALDCIATMLNRWEPEDSKKGPIPYLIVSLMANVPLRHICYGDDGQGQVKAADTCGLNAHRVRPVWETDYPPCDKTDGTHSAAVFKTTESYLAWKLSGGFAYTENYRKIPKYEMIARSYLSVLAS